MYRLAEEKIESWIHHSKKALLIYGARQVGKTYLIRKVLRANNIPYFEINLQEREDIVSMLRAEKDAAEELPVAPVISYFLCDSWYSSAKVMESFIRSLLSTIKRK